MDDLDRQLIALVGADGRAPVASLAAALGVSRATVRARIDKLMEDGVIQGFTAVIAGPEAETMRALTLIEVEGRAAERVIRKLRGFPEVRALWSTNGKWDIVAELEVADLPGFDRVLRNIREVDGISLSESNLLLATRKGR